MKCTIRLNDGIVVLLKKDSSHCFGRSIKKIPKVSKSTKILLQIEKWDKDRHLM